MKKILLSLVLVSLASIPESYAEIPPISSPRLLENGWKNESQRITPEGQYILDKVEQNKSQELLRKERTREQAMAGWKQYGSYSYNWKNWKLAPNGTRVTERVWSIDVPYENINSNLRPRSRPLRLDSVSKIIGVTCKGLKITKLSYDGWGE